MALGAGNVQVCTAAMTYGFKIVQEMISGLSQYGREGLPHARRPPIGRACRTSPTGSILNLNYVTKAQIDQDLCIKCGRCYMRLRGHLAPGDHAMSPAATSR
jgi:dihydropyrimidine dehydrogenase (NAD+) subunit PreA